MDWKITYYDEGVTEAIKKWPKGLKARYLRLLDVIAKNGPQLGPPHTDSLGDGLFEIRVKAQEGIGRAFFCYAIKKEIIIVHAIVKKTAKTPLKELKIARDRLKEVKL